MKIHFSEELGEIKGKSFKDGSGNPATYCSSICTALLDQSPRNPEQRTMADHMKRYKLAEKIEGTDPIEISTEEGSLIKQSVAEMCPTRIVVAVHDLIEGVRTPTDEAHEVCLGTIKLPGNSDEAFMG